MKSKSMLPDSTPMKHLLTLAALGLLPAEAALVSTINSNGRTIHVSTATGGSFISMEDLQSIVTNRNDLTTAAVLTGEASDGSSITIGDELANGGDPAKFTFTGPDRYSRNDTAVALAATSGERFGLVAGSNTWSVGSTLPLQGVTHFGAIFYGYLADGSANLVSVTATFDDATTAVYTATANPLEYTFVGFAAPDGKFITSIQVVEAGGGGWLGYDDVTIVTSVPETSAAILGSLGGLALLRRRRR